MYEHFFQCPHCWENISMLIDTSEAQQSYIEDCEVCCNPLEVIMQCKENLLSVFEVKGLGQ